MEYWEVVGMWAALSLGVVIGRWSNEMEDEYGMPATSGLGHVIVFLIWPIVMIPCVEVWLVRQNWFKRTSES